MTGTTYAFVFNGTDDWKIAAADDWEISLIDLDGTEKVIGHRKIDGSICKVIRTTDGKLVAITK